MSTIKQSNWISKLQSRFRFFRKSNKLNKIESNRLKLWQLYRYADKFDILLMIIGSIAAIFSGVVFALLLFLYGKVINRLVDTKLLQIIVNNSNISNNYFDQCFDNSSQIESPYDLIDGIINYFAILGFVSIVCYWIAWTTWNLAAERQIKRIRFSLFENILRQEIGWFDTHHTGELSNRLITDLNLIKDGINDKISDLISLVSRILGSLIYALIIGWKLTLVYLSIIPLMIITFNIIVKITVNYTNKQIKAFAFASSVAQEALRNIRTVTAFHNQFNEEEKFSKHLILGKNIEIRKGVYLGICQGLVYLFLFISYTLTFWYGPQLVRTDCLNYSPGSVMVIFVACMFATISIAYLTPNIQNIAEALTSATYIFEIIDRKTKIDALSNEGEQIENLIGDIQFENVTFSYPTRKDKTILNNLSMKIPFGKTIALVGVSGCGKSTIIQLIQRFYDVDQGQILLDGKDLKTLNVASLRSHIGIVSQESILFSGSIEDNIRFGKANATDQQVQLAAQMANAHDFIMKLPQNYKTMSSDKLSGGQKQRVAIARALISNPKILLLDEATSALDNISERIVQETLDKVRQGRTTIIIAHRLSTITNADTILVLHNGQIIEYGNHQQLIEQKNIYYQLITEQYTQNINQNKQQFNQNENISIESNSFDNHFEKKKTIDEQKDFHGSLIIKILKLNAPEWFWIVLGAISSLFFGTIQPLFALFLSQIFSLFAETNFDEQKRLVNIYTIAIFVTGLVGAITQICMNIAFTKSGEELTMRLRKLTFSSILRQEISYFDLQINSIENLTTRLAIDAAYLKNITGVRIGTMLQAISAMITALAVAFSVGWKLAFVVLCFAPLIIFTGILQGKKQNNIAKSKENSSFIQQAGQYTMQAIHNIRTVVGLHQEIYFLNLYENAFKQEFKKQMCRMHLTGLSAGIANSVTYFLYMTTFAYGTKLVKNGEMQFDEVIRVLVAITFAMTAIGRSIAMLDGYSQAKKAALRFIEINQRQSQINPHDQSGIILENVRGHIEFRDVHFRYSTRPNVEIVENLTFECLPNIVTALVGPSGSGKSTVVSLLERFYDPLKGNIFLDGHDIKSLNIRWLRSIIGFVEQQPIVFNISIRENIIYGDNYKQFTQQQIEDAARLANIHQEIISFPQGYDTLCGERGDQLSGGQKQRIAIARALIRQPKIILFDEATSALDNKSEQFIQIALDHQKTHRTCLTIAHRLSTIRNCQHIAVVYQGKIKEQGTHEQLLTFNGIYTKLIQIQQTHSFH